MKMFKFDTFIKIIIASLLSISLTCFAESNTNFNEILQSENALPSIKLNRVIKVSNIEQEYLNFLQTRHIPAKSIKYLSNLKKGELLKAKREQFSENNLNIEPTLNLDKNHIAYNPHFIVLDYKSGQEIAVDLKKDQEYLKKTNSFVNKSLSKVQNDNSSKLSDNSNVSEQEQSYYEIIGATGNFLQEYSNAEDKKAFLTNLGVNKVNGLFNQSLNNALTAYDGVNAEISANINYFDDGFTIKPSGKLLLPIYSVPKSFTFTQFGLTDGTNGRAIGHFGIGQRFYPFANDMTDLGNDMFGYNIFFDKDLDRYHERGSFGLEYMHNNLKFGFNYYTNLSGWKDSPDFEKGYVQERAAKGWDFNTKYSLNGYFSLNSKITHWLGRDISPFGSTDVESLEDSPFIYSIGASWNPVPAFSFDFSHEITSKKNTNTNVTANFNIPFEDIENAFNSDFINKANGNNILTSRSMFVDRDYTMPLQYRAKPGMYYIYFEKGLGNNKYLFRVEDGLHRPAPFVPVHVTPHHPSVELSNGGNYITDSTGHFVVEIIQSCVPEVDVTVQVGNTTIDFTLKVDKMSFDIKAEPYDIERWTNSTVTLYIPNEIISKGGSFDFLQKGLQIEWHVEGGDEVGKLSEVSTIMNSNGKSSVIFAPNPAKTEGFIATVIAHISEYNADYETAINVNVYGASTTDLTTSSASIDGGQYATITYKNLRPSTADRPNSVEFNVKSGACRVENTQPADVTPLTNTDIANTVSSNVDEQGVAIAYVIGSTDANTTGPCVVTAKTEDPYLNEPYREKPQAVVANNVYDAVWSKVPSVVYYEDPFTVELDKLKDNTQVIFGIDNNSAEVETIASFALNPRARMRLARAPKNAYATNTVIVKNKKAASEYLVTGDHSISIVEGVQAQYYHDAYNTKAPIDLSVYFNGIGSADTGLDIQHVEPMVFSSQGLANSGSMTPSNLKVLDTKLNSRSLPTYSGINSSGVTQYNGTDTMDYKTNYGYEFDGLLPNTDVTVTATNTTLSGVDADGNAVRSANSLKLHVDNDGKIKFGVNQVTDYNVKDINLKIAYQENYKGTVQSEKDFKVNLYQYPLKMVTDKDEIVADDSFVATVSGGKPGERVSWTLESGDGQIVSKDEVFNSNGVACANVNGKPEYKRDSTIKLITQLFENYKVLRKNVTSYTVLITGSIDPIGFYHKDEYHNSHTGKASFQLTTNFKNNILIYVSNESYHIGTSLDDNKLSKWDNTSYGYQGTMLNAFSETPYSLNLNKYISNGFLKFYLWECAGHMNTWYNSDVIFIFNNNYYYKYKTWKTSSTNYGWQFVTKGKYYEGLVPNL